MDTSFSSSDLAFQAEVRQFFDSKLSDELRARLSSSDTFRAAIVEWQQILYAKGWVAPNWPAEHGGTGWSAAQKFIYESERARAGAPDVIPFGLKMVGPVIYSFGNDEQKQFFLPAILKSEHWWCQGYSEPGAGSDLAALSTRAERDGDEYIVDGAKIWTSYAQYADWIFCLVRSSTEGKKQQGISFLLIDMTLPGISVNPIIGIDGRHTLNEVVFDNVRVPASGLIGEENHGWTYAKALLAHERTAIAGVNEIKNTLASIRENAAKTPVGQAMLIDDANFRRRYSLIEIELMALEYSELREVAKSMSGQSPGPESSLLKIRGTELQQRAQELLLYVAGNYAGAETALDIGCDFVNRARIDYMYGRAATIYGGSNEVQKNIIAKAILGLG
ncbi:MAG: acyl-CoA dehydrogenase family protein [Gammaproteobacteria bacterium]|nr:acyl-CoA dehydrogenase family protein [Gammaproteobacteria bacterium]MBT8150523.1 acyl-CoA dehydrogenase family protein [Gammaproteobacteria bacterium]NND38928.1 pimeloyl-CoA dehydrogenase large subunit [Pseudomonadales bacterium]RZV49906.1 MAG: pimeloyl-CoA dehydrogenase large subunit [Pseudomonadales bacterium]